ncbi:Trk system potassium uptake protein [Agaricicola taiwanensis]|uniref:Trk system potassium uptake protein n=1 Tax=Agaricicola taiwanensis TaxID=591372 RepID=A0A8J2YGI6_9RHOB|nr:TrkH family potassium uptake protein [Agaricicola taiwanensis]GGE35443.1 Trk system potassium uptake protein [Agaricicola taiwanensis]
MIDLRPINAILGLFVTLLGAMMLLPALVDLLAGSDDWSVFAASSAVSIFIGVALYSSGRTKEPPKLNVRQAFLLTTLSWSVLALFASLPFMWSQLNLSFGGAVFEAMSGLTTTGSSVITGLDALPPGLLLWRALLHFYGGIGIIVIALAVLPMLRVGGMQLFRTESSDKSEKMFPAAAQIAASTFGIYAGLNLLCIVAYTLAGMTAFDAVLHGMSTVATGGFSSHDASLGYYDSPTIEWIATLFMISGALPFALYIQVLRGRPAQLTRNPEVRLFLIIVAVVAVLLVIYQERSGIAHGQTAVRHAIFHVVNLMSTTGFAIVDYSAWGAFSDALFFCVMFLGGCMGSTAGGFKMFRLIVVAKTTLQQFMQMLYPNGIFPLTYDRRPMGDDVSSSVFAFSMLYVAVFIFVAVTLAASGLDFITALSASISALGNVGPGLGPLVGPAGNFSTIGEGNLWLLSFTMLVGRLELFTVLVLVLPRFWRS